MTIILFDTPQSRSALYPFTPTRSVAYIRHGILTIKEKWEQMTGLPVFVITEEYLNEKIPSDDTYVYVDATVIPLGAFVTSAIGMALDTALIYNGQLASLKTSLKLSYPIMAEPGIQSIEIAAPGSIAFPWQLFQTNEQAIRTDFELLTKDRNYQPIDASNVIIGKGNLFIEKGAVIRACIINVEEGPVYIGKNALVMEGTTIRGPVAIGENAVVKMGAKLYSGTSIGPGCTAGGEIKNSILMGYSNKAHDGYLGDSVIGEWCNLGAGTTNSNVKNTAGEVKMWSNAEAEFVPVGIKAGLLMGDYSRSAINSSFNTGTVVGTCCNVFHTGFPPKHIPAFSWGIETYELEKAIGDIGRWMKLKGKEMGEKEKVIIRHINTKQD
ncbi:MAG: putative sugar nucleotidyl transferase [Bacteroidota bacterium]